MCAVCIYIYVYLCTLLSLLKQTHLHSPRPNKDPAHMHEHALPHRNMELGSDPKRLIGNATGLQESSVEPEVEVASGAFQTHTPRKEAELTANLHAPKQNLNNKTVTNSCTFPRGPCLRIPQTEKLSSTGLHCPPTSLGYMHANAYMYMYSLCIHRALFAYCYRCMFI